MKNSLKSFNSTNNNNFNLLKGMIKYECFVVDQYDMPLLLSQLAIIKNKKISSFYFNISLQYFNILSLFLYYWQMKNNMYIFTEWIRFYWIGSKEEQVSYFKILKTVAFNLMNVVGLYSRLHKPFRVFY